MASSTLTTTQRRVQWAFLTPGHTQLARCWWKPRSGSARWTGGPQAIWHALPRSTPDPPQIHRYLNRVEVRWGILTNGTQWRLYHKGGRSISDDFLEIDLPAALGVRQPAEDLSWRLPDRPRRRHAVHPFHLLITDVSRPCAGAWRVRAVKLRCCRAFAHVSHSACRCGFMHQTNLLGPEPWQARVTHHAW